MNGWLRLSLYGDHGEKYDNHVNTHLTLYEALTASTMIDAFLLCFFILSICYTSNTIYSIWYTFYNKLLWNIILRNIFFFKSRAVVVLSFVALWLCPNSPTWLSPLIVSECSLSTTTTDTGYSCGCRIYLVTHALLIKRTLWLKADQSDIFW